MFNQLIKMAYPHLSENSPNQDSYYLIRLSELWGEELIEEYLESWKDDAPNFSSQITDESQYQEIPTFS